MKIDNKTGKIFGRPAVFAAYIFLFSAVVFLLWGAVVIGGFFVLISSFVLFSYSGVEIDTEKEVLRQYNKLFGLFKTGRWRSIHSFLGVTLIPFSRVDSTYSRSNRINRVSQTDYRIFLVSKARKPAFTIKKCLSPEQARDSLDEFSIWLKLPVFTPRK